ncbi:MAG: 2Fe-2S iron-sulfur cluster binding domain-containing protein, partial [Saprospiraceae bacterium]|nr:2Fe-2S iron-sulfur cluster binding domain-containing protein [Saprospiraceae bacterium]
SYSICAGPNDDELRVAIKKVPGGLFSTFANEQLQAGDTLEVMTPMGNFHTQLLPTQAKNYVAFAAGSGITPILSILKAVLETEPQSTFTLFYGNRTVEAVIFKEAIEALKNRFMGRLSVHYLLSREYPGSDLFYGRITAEKCAAFCKILFNCEATDEFFLCGPQEMVEAVQDTLTDLGADPNKIHVELFQAATGKQAAQAQERVEALPDIVSTVRVILDGNNFEFSLPAHGDTILDAAMKAGADLPFSCKGGVCSTCRAKLLEGDVMMEVNYALEADELEQGYILTCQSHPQSERVVVDFDS